MNNGITNEKFLIGIGLVLAAAIYTYQVVYVRINREAVMKRLKPGSSDYNRYLRLTSTPGLIVAIIILSLMIGNLVFDTLAVLSSHSNSKHFILVFAPIAAICMGGIALYSVRRYQKLK